MNTPETEFPNPAEYQPEWLSAYLDDELPEPQRLIVQQRLESDPAARQVLEDLQRIRHLVGQLPAWSGRDLPPVLPTDAAVESTETPPVDPAADARAADDSEAVDSAGG
ncbi:MAG: hypothetical protein KDA45_15335, partial [Planctomycetales bacterium]|nr:hypothetical protein [Planctomycetales bacterium]